MPATAEMNAPIGAVSREPSRSEAKTVLIVDDNQLIRALLSNFIEEMGLTPVEAANAVEALAMIRDRKPALVLMDIVMPGANGVEALQQIRDDATIADVPVIAVTTLAGGPLEADFLAAGFNAYLPKPINLSRFAEAVRRHIQ